jgi:hypothetical protein
MIGLQEMIRRTVDQRKEIEEAMDQTKSGFYPGDASILKGQPQARKLEMMETLRNVPLRHFIKEYLGSSGTAGLAGAAYLIPDKIYDVFFESACQTDIVPLCCNIVDCPGSSLKVDIEKTGQYEAHFFGGGGAQPTETIETTQATITPKLFGIRPEITNELIEDANWDVMELHLRRAAQEMGKFASNIFLGDLILGADGDGTQNAVTTATADMTYLRDLANGWEANAQDGYISDVAIITPEPLANILADATVSVYSDSFHTRALTDSPLVWGNFMGMKVVLVIGMNESYTGTGALYISSKWHSFVLNKANAMLAVRKRWLKIENYSKPIQDLVGASVTAIVNPSKTWWVLVSQLVKTRFQFRTTLAAKSQKDKTAL